MHDAASFHDSLLPYIATPILIDGEGLRRERALASSSTSSADSRGPPSLSPTTMASKLASFRASTLFPKQPKAPRLTGSYAVSDQLVRRHAFEFGARTRSSGWPEPGARALRAETRAGRDHRLEDLPAHGRLRAQRGQLHRHGARALLPLDGSGQRLSLPCLALPFPGRRQHPPRCFRP